MPPYERSEVMSTTDAPSPADNLKTAGSQNGDALEDISNAIEEANLSSPVAGKKPNEVRLKNQLATLNSTRTISWQALKRATVISTLSFCNYAAVVGVMICATFTKKSPLPAASEQLAKKIVNFSKLGDNYRNLRQQS